MLYFCPFGSKGFDDLSDPKLVDSSEGGHREAQGDKPLLLGEPKALFGQIWIKPALCLARHFETDPLFLFSDTTDGVLIASSGFSTRNLTLFGHS